MKRFYNLVTSEKTTNGVVVSLDGRQVKTKSGHVLFAPNDGIAALMVKEWAAQEDEIIPDSMPVTQILSTMIDRVSEQRSSMAPLILKYLDTDLVCYLVDMPEELATEQNRYWSPVRTWFEKKYDVSLQTTTGLAAISQDVKAHNGVAAYVDSLDDLHFTLLQLVTSISGSLILALSLLDRASCAQDVFESCFIEEHYKNTLYNAEKYGSDPMIEKKQQSVLRDLEAVERILSCL